MTCKYDFGLCYWNSFIEKSSTKVLTLRSFCNWFSNFLWKTTKTSKNYHITAHDLTIMGIFPDISDTVRCRTVLYRRKKYFFLFFLVKRISLLGNSHNFSAPTTTLPMPPPGPSMVYDLFDIINSISSHAMFLTQLQREYNWHLLPDDTNKIFQIFLPFH